MAKGVQSAKKCKKGTLTFGGWREGDSNSLLVIRLSSGCCMFSVVVLWFQWLLYGSNSCRVYVRSNSGVSFGLLVSTVDFELLHSGFVAIFGVGLSQRKLVRLPSAASF